jgi:septum formation protein
MSLRYQIILASNSPRRQSLLRELGIPFTVETNAADETYPDDMPATAVAQYLAHAKARAFRKLKEGELLITSDTTVVVDDTVLNKPADKDEAYHMLQQLSGRCHKVITGVCLLTASSQDTFQDETVVHMRHLRRQEIEFYLDHHKPYDKAGAYGIQEWIGLATITRLEGSYYNVMGLPTHKLWQRLQEYGSWLD